MVSKNVNEKGGYRVLNLVIRLSSVEEIQDFVRRCSKLDCDIDLTAGRYTVDAKSILGVFSIDLKRDLQLQVYTDNKKHAEEVLRDYVVKKIA